MSPAEEDPDESPDAPARPTGALPAGLTSAAREAFRDVEEEFRDALTAELRRRRRWCPDLTTEDVYEARTVAAQTMYRSSSGGSAPAAGADPQPVDGRLGRPPSTLGTALMIGSVGVANMHPFLPGPWQVGVSMVCGLTGLTGVGLTWRSGHRVDASVDTVG